MGSSHSATGHFFLGRTSASQARKSGRDRKPARWGASLQEGTFSCVSNCPAASARWSRSRHSAAASGGFLNPGRKAVRLEAITGQLFLALLVARLIGLHTAESIEQN